MDHLAMLRSLCLAEASAGALVAGLAYRLDMRGWKGNPEAMAIVLSEPFRRSIEAWINAQLGA